MAIANSTRTANPAAICEQGVYTFTKIYMTKSGDFLAHDDFAMPAETYSVGWKRGETAAMECLRHAAKCQAPSPMIAVIKRAGQILMEIQDEEEGAPSQRGAAAGFLRTIEHFAVLGLKAQKCE